MGRRELPMLGSIVSPCSLVFTSTYCHPLGVSFRILITGGTSGLVETITDAVSIHSIKKAEYARRLAEGRLGHVTLFDHFKSVSFCYISLIFPMVSLRRLLDLWRPIVSEVCSGTKELREVSGRYTCFS